MLLLFAKIWSYIKFGDLPLTSTGEAYIMKNTPGYTIRSAITSFTHCYLFGVLVVITLTTGACGQGISDDAEWLIEVLKLHKGDVIAEMGAGDGRLTLAIAKQVGPKGHVYSSELGADSVEYLQKVVDSNSASNITVIKGHPDRTNFPKECCNALFMRRVYHHFGNPASMNKSIWRSLKPGGRVAIIDFAPRSSESGDPGKRDSYGQHGVTADTVIEELKKAGFTLISSKNRSGRNIYVVMEKPE